MSGCAASRSRACASEPASRISCRARDDIAQRLDQGEAEQRVIVGYQQAHGWGVHAGNDRAYCAVQAPSTGIAAPVRLCAAG
jgi:hypothetical protein